MLRLGAVLLGIGAAGCNALVADAGESGEGDATSSTGETHPATTDDPLGSTGTSAATSPSSTSGADDSTTSGADASTGSSSTTGGDDPAAIVELVVQRETPSGGRLLELCTIEGVALDSCEALHAPDERSWYPHVMPERRLLLEARTGDVPSELRVVSLDDPKQSTRIDVGTEPPGVDSTPVVVETDGSVLYAYEGMAYRAELDGFESVSVSALVEHRGLFRPTTDPQGRFALIDTPCSDACETVRVWFDDQSVESISSWGMPWLTADGNAGFVQRSLGNGLEALDLLPIVELANAPTTLLSEAALFTAFGEPGSHLFRPDADRPGVALTVGDDSPSFEYVGVENGVPLPPVSLTPPGGTLTWIPRPDFIGQSAWSPDGRWLYFLSETADAVELWVADFQGGHTPTMHRVPVDSVPSIPPVAWAPDSSGLYVARYGGSDGAAWTRRVLLTGNTPIVQEIGGDGESVSSLSDDGSVLLLAFRESASAEPLAASWVDVSGEEPGAPQLLLEASPGERVSPGRASSDGRYATVVVESDEVRRLWVAALHDEAPPHVDLGEARSAWFVPGAE